ncbi:hypothetical protein ABZ353_10955 [Streptomyces niveus]|uniref:hypothetical protein n=1 Tax=Streptomyces niveus TaxID=193462 RepID=UPI0033E99BD5
MTYGTLEWHKERHDYWYRKYVEANKRAGASIAEAKKAKERLLAAARLALKYKKSADAIVRIAEAADNSPGYVDFGKAVLGILEELGYEIT